MKIWIFAIIHHEKVLGDCNNGLKQSDRTLAAM